METVEPMKEILEEIKTTCENWNRRKLKLRLETL